MPGSEQPQVAFALECLECGVQDNAAAGWRAYLDPDGDGVLVFCADVRSEGVRSGRLEA